MNFGGSRTGVIQKISLYLAADFLISYADFWTFRGRFTQGAVSFTTFSAQCRGLELGHRLSAWPTNHA